MRRPRSPTTKRAARRRARAILPAVAAVIGAAAGLAPVAALGATATFVPVGPTAVPAGTPVAFQITLTVETLEGFDSADIVIGSNDATDLTFAYSPDWIAAFANVTPPVADVGFYAQDVFVGGNNPTSVGTTIVLGTVTADTTGMTDGAYEIRIDSAADTGVSALTLAGLQESVIGTAQFTVGCVAMDAECDGDLDLNDYAAMSACLTGPGAAADPGCVLFDADLDGDVDLADLRTFMLLFTG